MLLTAPDDGVATGAQVVHQVRIALAQGRDGAVFGVALAPFEPLQDQHAMALVLADALADGLQCFPKGTGGFALAFTGVDLDALHAQLAGGLVQMRTHLRVQISQVHQGARCTAAGGDHLQPRGLGRKGAGDFLNIQQPQVEHRVELVEHHNGVQLAGQGAPGDVPATLGFLAIKAGDFLGGEVITPAGAHLVNQVGETLLEGFNGSVLGVGAAGTFEKAQQQDPGAFLLADAQSNRAQDHAKGGLAFALPLAVINMQLTTQAFITAGGCANADATAGAGGHRPTAIRARILTRLDNVRLCLNHVVTPNWKALRLSGSSSCRRCGG